MHIIYYTATGELICPLTCSDNLVDLTAENFQEQHGLFRDYPSEDMSIFETHYHDRANTILVRPEITATPNKPDLEIVADGSDLFILTGLPIPCTVTVKDTNIETEDIVTEVTDGEFGFPTSFTGTYIVSAKWFPYIPKSWEVTAI